MTRPLRLELSEEAYRALEQRAAAAGESPAAVAASTLEIQLRPQQSPQSDAEIHEAIELLKVHFGAVSLGAPTGLDNEQIDEDLARSYADTHEDS